MLGQRDRWRFSERRDASAQLGLHPDYDLSVCAVHAACFSRDPPVMWTDIRERLCAFLGNHTPFFYFFRFAISPRLRFIFHL